MADHGVTCSMSRSGSAWHNAATESFFSSLKTERPSQKTYRTRDQARTDGFDCIERFYNPRRRHSTLGILARPSTRKRQYQLNCVCTEPAAAQLVLVGQPYQPTHRHHLYPPVGGIMVPRAATSSRMSSPSEVSVSRLMRRRRNIGCVALLPSKPRASLGVR